MAVAKAKKSKKVLDAPKFDESTQEGWLSARLTELKRDMRKLTEDGRVPVEEAGKLVQSYAMKGTEIDGRRLVLGYKRAYKVAFEIQTVEAAAHGRG